MKVKVHTAEWRKHQSKCAQEKQDEVYKYERIVEQAIDDAVRTGEMATSVKLYQIKDDVLKVVLEHYEAMGYANDTLELTKDKYYDSTIHDIMMTVSWLYDRRDCFEVKG